MFHVSLPTAYCAHFGSTIKVGCEQKNTTLRLWGDIPCFASRVALDRKKMGSRQGFSSSSFVVVLDLRGFQGWSATILGVFPTRIEQEL